MVSSRKGNQWGQVLSRATKSGSKPSSLQCRFLYHLYLLEKNVEGNVVLEVVVDEPGIEPGQLHLELGLEVSSHLSDVHHITF